jgi:gas vesicle protein
MKNLFEKQNNNAALIALGIAGAAAAGALAYLYLTDNGSNTREKISDTVSTEVDKLAKTFTETFKDLAAGFISDTTNVSKKAVKSVADHVA